MTHTIQNGNRKSWSGLFPAACLALLTGCYTGLSDPRLDGASDGGSGAANGGDADEDSGPEDEPVDPPGATEEHVPTPLARLTNDEFVNSAAILLGIPADSEHLAAERAKLAAEPNISGLSNDSALQLLTHVGISSYSNVAAAMTDVFLAEVLTLEDLAARIGCAAGNEGSDLAGCIRDFSAQLLSQAFRREVTDQELSNIDVIIEQVDAALADSDQDLEAFESHVLRLRTLMRYVLLSADFLLLVERGDADLDAAPEAPIPLTSAEIAARLSYFITGTLPDEALMADVREDRLLDPSVRLEHADRLLDTDAGRAQFTKTLTHWLGIDQDIASTADMAVLSTFIDQWYTQAKPFEDLYQAPVAVEHVDGTVTEQPFGILGLRAFVASHSAFPTPSFITRGVFLVERLLCAHLPSDIPAEALDGEEMTPLEVFEQHAKQPCATCHVVFDNYGATFQQFDTETALFDPEATELGDSFELQDLGGVSGVATDVADLGAIMGQSERAPECLAELWYRKAARRSLDANGGDEQALEDLIEDWRGSGDTSMKSLMRSVVASESFAVLFP